MAPKACKFCGIVAGSQKAFTVYRDSICVAFLDYRPLALGHTLLVPLTHYAELGDVPDDVIAAMGVAVKRLSAAVIQAMAADGSFIALNNRISQSVPHVHFHIVPRRKGAGLFARQLIWNRAAYRDDPHREETAAKIAAAL